MKKSLFNPNGYSKHKNEGLSNIANAIVSIADGELDKVTLENKEETIHLTVVEKGAKEETSVSSTPRDEFRKTLKGNPGLLPYYISEYFGNKEVPRYLTKGEAAYAMTADIELELMGVKNGKGGSIIMSSEPISFVNNEAYDNYKTFLVMNGKKTPSVDKLLEQFTFVETDPKNEAIPDYDSALIFEAQKLYDKNRDYIEEAKNHLEDAKKSIELAREYDDEENIQGEDDIENFFENKKEEDDDNGDAMINSIAHKLNSAGSNTDEEVDANNELLHDMEEIKNQSIIEDKTPDNFEEEVLSEMKYDDEEEDDLR